MKYIVILFLILQSCSEKNVKDVAGKSSARTKLNYIDSVRVLNFWNKSSSFGLYSTLRQKYLDSALFIAPDSAFFWQQKAMPFYKARKYSLGKPFLEKAVEYNPKKYLEYSAFMKCLFSKEYNESIGEFMLVKERYGDSYVMDHTHNFYLGLNYLQLNEFEKAKEFLEKSKEQQIKDFPKRLPEHAVHHLDWFYLGVVNMELQNCELAIANFDMALKVYKNFGDALYFKASCLDKLGKKVEANKVIKAAYANIENTINEDNVFYEIYPYQVFHKLSPLVNSK